MKTLINSGIALKQNPKQKLKVNSFQTLLDLVNNITNNTRMLAILVVLACMDNFNLINKCINNQDLVMDMGNQDLVDNNNNSVKASDNLNQDSFMDNINSQDFQVSLDSNLSIHKHNSCSNHNLDINSNKLILEQVA